MSSLPPEEASDDETPSLSATTLAALQSFYAEQTAQAEALTKAARPTKNNNDESIPDPGPLSMAPFTEDWNASQFWYTDDTARALARSLLSHNPNRIVVISAPSAFAALKYVLHHEYADKPKPEIVLLEYDTRFGVWPEFVKYDYTQPTRLPVEMKGTFDAVIVDPPFLSDECQTKAALTVRWLARDWSSEGLKILACTGERMGDLVKRLYGRVGARETDFVVEHGSGLGNEFRCFGNFEWSGWKFIQDEKSRED